MLGELPHIEVYSPIGTNMAVCKNQKQMHILVSICMLRSQSFHRATTSMAGSAGSSRSSGDEGPVSLQQRMQQALTADIAPSAAPRGAPNPHLKQGPGLGSGGGLEATSSMQEEDTGFWDLVYILYPDFAEGAGVGPLRELVPHWSLLERTLMVCAVPLHIPVLLCLLLLYICCVLRCDAHF